MATPAFRSTGLALLTTFVLCAIAFHHHAVVAAVDAGAAGSRKLASPLKSAQVSRPSGGSRGRAGQLSESAVCFHTGGAIHGAQARLSVSPLPLVATNQTSESSITVSRSHPSGVNSIRAGWHVSPSLYGDANSRLFTYWTTRNDWSDGCYNTLCPGFIRDESSPVEPGHVLDPTYTITLAIEQDEQTGDWWLYYGGRERDYVAVGHWPKQLFNALDTNADTVEFGGEVFFDGDDSAGGPPMGSGHLGTETDKAASFMEMQQIDVHGVRHLFGSMDEFRFYADNRACYDTKLTQGALGVFTFFYGGPACQKP